MHSPWGKVRHRVTWMRGVHEVHTAGHGGLGVALGVASKLLPDTAIKAGAIIQGGYAWFEEDCAINLALYESPTILGALLERRGKNTDAEFNEYRAMVRASVIRWYPDYPVKG